MADFLPPGPVNFFGLHVPSAHKPGLEGCLQDILEVGVVVVLIWIMMTAVQILMLWQCDTPRLQMSGKNNE